MLTVSPAVRIYVATGATDLRRSIDGLSALVRQQLQLDPLSGASAPVS
jgi:transposase